MTWAKFSEIIDSLRVFPRIVLLSYMITMGVALDWYFDFEVKYVVKCDPGVMQVILAEAPGNIKLASSIACAEVDVLARPGGYTALMATLVGAGAGIFGFYVNSGIKR